jgi:hypothetical protein
LNENRDYSCGSAKEELECGWWSNGRGWSFWEINTYTQVGRYRKATEGIGRQKFLDCQIFKLSKLQGRVFSFKFSVFSGAEISNCQTGATRDVEPRNGTKCGGRRRLSAVTGSSKNVLGRLGGANFCFE